MSTLVKSRLTNRRRPSDLTRAARQTTAPRAKAVVLAGKTIATEPAATRDKTHPSGLQEPATRLLIARNLVKGAIFNQRVALLNLCRKMVNPPPSEFLGLRLLQLMTDAGHALSLPTLKELYLQAEALCENVVLEHLEGLLLDGCQGDVPARAVCELLQAARDTLREDCRLLLVESGLDTTMGILHADDHALATDLAMVFRPLIADAAVLRLLQLRQITSRDLDLEAGCCQLTQHGRKKVDQAVDKQLHMLAPSALPGIRHAFASVLKDQIASLGAYLRGEEEVLKVYLCAG
ncbi:MAG: CRISPR-associated endonuclease Cas1 [Gemmatales bacterium]